MEFKLIMEKYTKEMVEYTEEAVPAFDAYVKENQKTYSNIVDRLFSFYMFASYLLDERILKENKENEPIFFLYLKSSLSLFGISSCLRNGLVTEAAILFRSIFEIYVDLKLILEDDVESRLRLFSDYRHVARWIMLENKRKQLENAQITQERFDMNFTDEIIDLIDSKYEAIKENYHPTIPYHWAWKIFKSSAKSRNPSYRSISDHLGIIKEYEDVYSTMSIAVHSVPLIDNFMRLNKRKTLVPTFSESTKPIAVYALDIAERILSEVIDYLKPDEGEDLKIFTKAYVLRAMKAAGFIE